MRRGSLFLLVVLASLTSLVPAAYAQQGRLVTIAARSCPAYTDITANRARNDIMESLKNLGRDTPYGQDGRPLLVDPKTEAEFQKACSPISNWQFTLGTGYRTRAIDGVWGSLSIVTKPFDTSIVTKDSVPLLEASGEPSGETIAGATTITLTDDQSKLAADQSKLWIQGGTPTQPITDPVTYGFGALRCATDNLNGDNVEWISYPVTDAHVFCFAYYVKPAPTSGTIVVRKEVSGPGSDKPQTFKYSGNISFTGNNEFFLTAKNDDPAEQLFIRAVGSKWTFREHPQALATLTSLECGSAKDTSISTTDVRTGAASVVLAAGDTVTCTYKNTLRRPPGGLVIRKITQGGIGSFGFAIEGDRGTANGRATTTEPNLAAVAEPSTEIADLPAGDYRVTEDPPANRGGTWSLESVNCLGALRERSEWSAAITIPDSDGATCTFTNQFTPAGQITLNKTTLGGTGTTRFQVRPQFGENRPEREQLATTTEPGAPARATGDKLSELPIGRYTIQETTSGPDRWEVGGVSCNGVAVSAITGLIEITLTAEEPEVDCEFINQRVPDAPVPTPEPQPPVPPGPPEIVPQTTGGGDQAYGLANLIITKRAVPRRVRLGGLIRFTIDVVNRGPDPAENVTVLDTGSARPRGRLPLRPEGGTCRRRPPRYCRFGTLAPGERARLRVTIRTQRTGRFVNTVAVNSSTPQSSRRGKRARARIVILAPRRPRFTG